MIKRRETHTHTYSIHLYLFSNHTLWVADGRFVNEPKHQSTIKEERKNNNYLLEIHLIIVTPNSRHDGLNCIKLKLLLSTIANF